MKESKKAQDNHEKSMNTKGIADKSGRVKTRAINVGGVVVGGGAPISVQSMTNTNTADSEATIAQINRLTEAGCEIVRVAVPDAESAKALVTIKKAITIPLIADIHFDWRLAIEALKNGVDALRLNPGNIGSKERIGHVVRATAERGIPIRIGVNGGSLEKEILEEFGHPSPEAMVQSALKHIRILEDLNFTDIKVSLKASSVPVTIAAYRLLSSKVDYPLHIGITEAGTLFSGTVKSAVGLGSLLSDGIGDTLRVSLTADPVEEVRVGWEILKALELRSRGVNIISCPTCGRIKIDCEKLALGIEEALGDEKESITIAVMGCVVNGPGEAKEADIGVAGGDGVALLYLGGEVAGKIPEKDLVEVVIKEAKKIIAARK